MQKDCEKSSLPKFPVPPLYILLLIVYPSSCRINRALTWPWSS